MDFGAIALLVQYTRSCLVHVGTIQDIGLSVTYTYKVDLLSPTFFLHFKVFALKNMIPLVLVDCKAGRDMADDLSMTV